jgi:molybdate transport system substrate-binding protein
VKPILRLLAVPAAMALLVSACGDDDDSSETTSADDGTLEGSITVSAAASLTDAFTEIGDALTAENPDADVALNLDSSSTLASQILEGAPADVFASADETNMTLLTDEDLVSGSPEVFARNELVIVTKPENPEGITGLADLAGAGVISLCGADVPCGQYAQEALDAAGVSIPEGSVTRGQNATATLTAVSQGDAVAGIVYVTDAWSAADAVETVEIPVDVNVIAVYPIGVLAASENIELAEAFVERVLSDEGQAILEELGFLAPA